MQKMTNNQKNNQTTIGLKRYKIEYVIFTAGIVCALLKHWNDKINLIENKYFETFKLISILVSIILSSIVLYKLQKTSLNNSQFRCHGDEGLFCTILLPAAFIFNCLQYNDVISPAYKIITIISIETSYTMVMTLIYTNERKMYLLVINLIIITLLALITQIWPIVLILSIICQTSFILLLHSVSVIFSKSFTIGELHLVCQGIVLFLSACVFHFHKLITEPVNTIHDTLHEVNTVISITLTGLMVIFLSLKLVPILKTPIYFYTVCVLIEVGLTFIIMYAALRQNPLVWLLNYLLNTHQRIIFVSYLFICIASTIAFTIWQNIDRKSSKLKRKIFHIIIIIVYIPGFYMDVELLLLSSAGMIAIFLTLECLRFLNIPPLGKIIQDNITLFLDEKDCGLLIVSHIYLLVGSTISLWINPCHQVSLSIMSGVLAIGFGDSVAAFVGILWGKHKWPNSMKTYEGTIGAFFVQYLITLLIFYFTNKNVFNIYNSIYVLTVTVFAVLFEAFTTQFDNLVLPLYLYVMLIFI
ncbi:dolichol kinase [Centruroides vittatus]|uniref:dolichol kinase n=1 Tax=Centruroides vittatus TaxID=120091 RepID=UPI00350FDDE7